MLALRAQEMETSIIRGMKFDRYESHQRGQRFCGAIGYDAAIRVKLGREAQMIELSSNGLALTITSLSLDLDFGTMLA